QPALLIPILSPVTARPLPCCLSLRLQYPPEGVISIRRHQLAAAPHHPRHSSCPAQLVHHFPATTVGAPPGIHHRRPNLTLDLQRLVESSAAVHVARCLHRLAGAAHATPDPLPQCVVAVADAQHLLVVLLFLHSHQPVRAVPFVIRLPQHRSGRGPLHNV